jgi:hypothetical protein
VWGVSLTSRVDVTYHDFRAGADWVALSASGEVWFCRWLRRPNRVPGAGESTFSLFAGVPDPDSDVIRGLPGLDFLGLFFHHSGRNEKIAFGTVVIIPYWAIGVVVLIAVAWVDRRRRRRRGDAQGFGVLPKTS